jgi:hypothetical protein
LETRQAKDISQDAQHAEKEAKKRRDTNEKECVKSGKTKTSGKKSTKKRKEKTTTPTSHVSKKARVEKVVPEQQGLREVPRAKDTHGCVHKGLRCLTSFDRPYLKSFVRNESCWLYKKPCVDCAANKNNDADEMRVLDVAILLEDSGRKNFGYYCNDGQNGHKMDQDDPNKKSFTCDFVLCQGCYDKRVTIMEGDGKRRTRQTRSN